MKSMLKQLLLFFAFFYITIVIYAQDETFEYQRYHFVSPDEVEKMHTVGRDFFPTDPPPAPVRNIAEFERMQSVLIRYPFGIPIGLIVEMAQDCHVTTIVANSSQENTVRNTYLSNGVNIQNCDFIHAPSDSYWTRDYGPWFVVNGLGEFGITNFPYNRPRPNDNDIPIAVANYLGIELYGMSLIHTGGNYMTDGLGVSASTDLVYSENPDLTATEVDDLVYDYLGIEQYHVLPDPLGDYIEHIDCWGKFLDVDKVLIGKVAESDPRYEDFEYVANYFATHQSSYGNNYQVYRVETPGGNPPTPYTNSLILNKKVFVPVSGHSLDDQALQVYQEAMPGYEVIGVTGSWYDTDALHCRTKGIADIGMLHIKHLPLLGEVNYEDQYLISAIIRPYSDSSIYNDSVLIKYKINNGVYSTVKMNQIFGYRYEGLIPGKSIGSVVSYYIYAADKSGRRETHPFIGSPDPHVFTIIDQEFPDLSMYPDSLLYYTYEQCIEGQELHLYNINHESEVVIQNVLMEATNGNFYWNAIPESPVEFPYTLLPQDTLTFTVYIGIPVDVTGAVLYDSIQIETSNSVQYAIIGVDSDLVGIDEVVEVPVIVFPNPFTSQLNISFIMRNNPGYYADVSIYSLNGSFIRRYHHNFTNSSNNTINWDGKDQNGMLVEKGIYFIKFSNNSFEKVIKVIRN